MLALLSLILRIDLPTARRRRKKLIVSSTVTSSEYRRLGRLGVEDYRPQVPDGSWRGFVVFVVAPSGAVITLLCRKTAVADDIGLHGSTPKSSCQVSTDPA